ncbi:MAG: hypothetical protein A2452_11125 [Candidatus Firestonebacteria bacterium RIFOXYC2_FULL_39_67]|nr:MAG: hypothetical protein A2452_11125 [Candidatus Firestonebacteria bacterium RIFOXYC2_FULL_39_67]
MSERFIVLVSKTEAGENEKEVREYVNYWLLEEQFESHGRFSGTGVEGYLIGGIYTGLLLKWNKEVCDKSKKSVKAGDENEVFGSEGDAHIVTENIYKELEKLISWDEYPDKLFTGKCYVFTEYCVELSKDIVGNYWTVVVEFHG